MNDIKKRQAYLKELLEVHDKTAKKIESLSKDIDVFAYETLVSNPFFNDIIWEYSFYNNKLFSKKIPKEICQILTNIDSYIYSSQTDEKNSFYAAYICVSKIEITFKHIKDGINYVSYYKLKVHQKDLSKYLNAKQKEVDNLIKDLEYLKQFEKIVK